MELQTVATQRAPIAQEERDRPFAQKGAQLLDELWRLASARGGWALLLLCLSPVVWPVLAFLAPRPLPSAELVVALEVLAIGFVFSALRLHKIAAERSRLRHVQETSRVIAQDMRTPLTTVALVAQALRQELSTWEHSPQQALILCGRLDAIVRNLNQALDMHIANAGLEAVEARVRQELSAGAIVAEAVETYAFRGERERGIVLTTVRRDFKIRGSQQALVGCIHNLIKNSLKALHAKGVSLRQGDIQIEVGTFQGRGRIVLTDRGCGIDESIQERVSDPFFTSTPGDAHGLGLAFARAAIQHAGGSLRLESVAGKGTTAVAEIPIAD